MEQDKIDGKAFCNELNKIATRNGDNYANIMDFNIKSVTKLSPQRMNNSVVLGCVLKLFWSVYIHNIKICATLDGDFGTPITSTTGSPAVIAQIRKLINGKAMRTLLKHDSKNMNKSVTKARHQMMNSLKMVNQLNKITNSVFQFLQYGNQVLSKFQSTYSNTPYHQEQVHAKSARDLINTGIAEGIKRGIVIFSKRYHNGKSVNSDKSKDSKKKVSKSKNKKSKSKVAKSEKSKDEKHKSKDKK